jgi:HPt (histidine-containing phosphotransfer) domain-containing protein
MSASPARAIDFNHLDAYTAGDTDLIREVLRLFRGQVAQLIGVLAEAGDAKTWKDTAHGIKGAARGIGAWEAAEAAAQVEHAQFADAAARATALARLANAFKAVCADIETELATAH